MRVVLAVRWDSTNFSASSMPMSSPSKPCVGFIERNFTQVEKLSNNSNRWKWQCNHCPSNAALVEHRDQNCLQHISKPVIAVDW
ncbi:hypothetical protein JB92DRAFT_3185093, partial [Gautieria morchelliformis]